MQAPTATATGRRIISGLTKSVGNQIFHGQTPSVPDFREYIAERGSENRHRFKPVNDRR